jgi:hypothetical protein
MACFALFIDESKKIKGSGLKEDATTLHKIRLNQRYFGFIAFALFYNGSNADQRPVTH